MSKVGGGNGVASGSFYHSERHGDHIDHRWSNVSLCEVNRARTAVGSPPLTWCNTLARTAQKWATVLEMDGCKMEHSTQ